MKVLVTTFGGDGGKSGIGQYIIQLLRCFPSVAPDIEWDVLMYKEEEDFYISDSTRMRPLFYGNSIRRPMLNLAWQQLALPWIVAKGKYDVLFVPAGNRRMPIWTPCPRVGTFHDLASRHVEGKYDLLHAFYNLGVLPALVRRLSLVISVSESTKRDLLEYVGVPEERIVVIPEAADSEVYFPRAKDASMEIVAQRYGVDAPYVLYVSRIEHPGKNHARLIRAFERLKESEDIPHTLMLAGSDWTGAEEVHRIAEGCAHSKDIVFTGFVPNDDLPHLYSGADLFVFPSLFEGFGLPILEAMACGVPVACSNVSSMPEVAGNAGLLFDPMDEAAIEEAMRRVLLEVGLREEYAALGLARSKEFSWESTAAQTVEAIRGVVSGTRGPNG